LTTVDGALHYAPVGGIEDPSRTIDDRLESRDKVAGSLPLAEFPTKALVLYLSEVEPSGGDGVLAPSAYVQARGCCVFLL
jgi:hypothetical protein